MNQKVDVEPVFVLHSRPFRNSSLLVELFSQHYGRLSAVANSARGPKSRYKGILQPFRLLLASWSGKRELKSLGQLELSGLPVRLQGSCLFCGYYLNELLMHFLVKDDANSVLFLAYQQALFGLAQSSANIEQILRQFERRLLIELGYGLQFAVEAASRQLIRPDGFYTLVADRGFMPVGELQREQSMVFAGQHLLAIDQQQWQLPGVLPAAKKIFRYLIQYHLNGKPINSRELIRAML